jgi:hypothetical protein
MAGKKTKSQGSVGEKILFGRKSLSPRVTATRTAVKPMMFLTNRRKTDFMECEIKIYIRTAAIFFSAGRG